MNKLEVGDNDNKTIYINEEDNYLFELGSNAYLKVYHLITDKSPKVIINLNGDNSKVDYYFSIINYNDNKYSMVINHNCSNTESNVFNHGVNVKDKKLDFIIDGVIPVNSNKCVCNQDNRIINLDNGKSTICPNLLIDNYDTIASHSAYIGQFKKDILFYFMSRGVTKKKSLKLLMKGFLLNHKGIDLNKVKEFKQEIEKI